MEPEISLPWSQDPATDPEPDASSLHIPALFPWDPF
jgi:hypothetical protein